ncbi:hypothetical protein, partial [Actinacidiphila glaucinigra]|uniref:hypothetical protein n=1 Tax=Actinacidiphila glaucinigra TaxID=235986 RepID=UPI001C65E8DE
MPKVNARYVDTPSIRSDGRGSFEEIHSEDAGHVGIIPPDGAALVKTFTESLILAQDERWRR